MKIQTKELTGVALDFSVAVAFGWRCERPQDGQFIDHDDHRWLAGYHRHAPSASFSPSTNWAHGGLLVDAFDINVGRARNVTWAEGVFYAVARASDLVATEYGETKLIAICRAVVACRLGDEVEVPDELVGGA